MSEGDEGDQTFRQFGELNQQLQHHVGQVVRGVIPGAGPQHEYHPNPYLQHLYHRRQQARGQGGAEGERNDLQNAQLDMPLDDVEPQPNTSNDEDENLGAATHTHTHGHPHHPHGPRRPGTNMVLSWKNIMDSATIGLIFSVFVRQYIRRNSVPFPPTKSCLIFLGLYAAFYYANLKMVEIVNATSLRERQAGFKTVLTGLWLILFLVANIACTYFMFSDQHLWRILYFHLPSTWQGNLFDLFWVTMVTDNVVKFGCIIIKCAIALTPHMVVQQKQKGKYYMLIEVFVLMYRITLPIVPWMHFLYDNSGYARPIVPWMYFLYDNSGYARLVFAAILVIAYLILKAYGLGVNGLQLKKAFQRLKTDTIYGTKPSTEEVKSQGENGCPICQDDYQDPIMLSCKHIFCENCVSLWFDREKTCPMCRHKVQTDSLLWRDGSTSGHLQWY